MASVPSWVPKSVQSLRGYTWQLASSDVVAGVTVGLVALPLAMAFAISSGVPPESGLYCAVVAGFLISALGGSKVQVGGPTGAFVVVVAGIVAKHGVDGLFMCTMMAGVVLLLMGATGLGSAVKFIPRPVVVGFTNGIAVLIASTQIKDFFGLQIDHVPGEFLLRMDALAGVARTFTPLATGLSLGSLALILLVNRYVKRVPGSIVALFAGTMVAVFARWPVETIGSRFGGIPSGFPHLVVPKFRPELISPLLPSVMTVAMLGAIESLLSAVVADRMSGDKHDPNTELMAQGIANIASPLVGGLPATGAVARTATNVRSGAKTPVSGMVHALTLLAVLLFAAPLAKQIPLAVLAAILMVVSYNMGEWREIPAIVRTGKADAAVWLITFALTVFADLSVAVEAGMILAALLYIQKVTRTTTVTEVTPEDVESGVEHSLQAHALPNGVSVFRIHGPFLFGSTDKLEAVEEQIDTLGPVVVLRLRNMTAVDATGLHAIEELAVKLRASGREIIVCGAREQPRRLMERTAFHRHIGDANIVPSYSAAVQRAEELVQAKSA